MEEQSALNYIYTNSSKCNEEEQYHEYMQHTLCGGQSRGAIYFDWSYRE